MSEANQDAASRPMDRIVTRDDLGGNEIEIAALPESGLLACPFCGEPPFQERDEEGGTWVIGCIQCNPSPCAVHSERSKAEKWWNTRACAKDNAND